MLVSCVMRAQVGIGTTNPDPSSVLDISSNSQGLLIPRMSSQERESISSPASGLLVFDTDLLAFVFSDGETWSTIGKTRGINSGINPTGWVSLIDADYQLTLSGISLSESSDPTNFSDVELNFLNDSSDQVIETYAPDGFSASDFFDNETHKIKAIQEGDTIELHLNFNAVPDANNSFLVIALDIGNPNGNIIFQKTIPLLRSSGDSNKISETIMVYQLESFVTNGAKLKVGYSTTSGLPGNVTLSDFSLLISRIHTRN
ncbi:hypothetical protein ICJ83_06530 [Aestuariibaculum sp. TT11]|uniref:Uncharacterized protein n=2 Tax=Aestuariibaculum sediminum TaxID=2770637 RepID=A0A8J6Q272_9FLAO|nr:hypothetical protein [Aestuariibaculum sediminum]